MTQYRTQARAFTLLEVTIVLGIFVIMLIALYTFFISTNSTYLYEQAFVDTASSAGNIMKAVTDAAFPADQVLASYTVAGSTNYTSSATTLILEMPAIDSSGAVISGKFDHVVFYVSGVNAYERTDPDPASSRNASTKLLSDAVTGLTFTYDNVVFPQVQTVTVDVVTQAKAHQNTAQDHLTRTLHMRNVAAP